MKVVYEVTEWADSNVNHVYHMNDSMTKIYSYARWGNPADTQTFSKPIQIVTQIANLGSLLHDKLVPILRLFLPSLL